MSVRSERTLLPEEHVSGRANTICGFVAFGNGLITYL